jgi:hypothetical protein
MTSGCWHKVSEVADILATSQSRVLTLIHSGEIDAVDVSENPGTGRPRWRVTPEALQRFAEQRSSRARHAPEPNHKTKQNKQRRKSARTFV